MSPDRPLLGIGLMLCFCILAPLGDALAKLLGQTLPVAQILLVRFLAQVVFLLPVALVFGLRLRFTPRQTWRIFQRTVLHILGIGMMFTSLLYLPLADAVAIAFVMPFIMLLLGKLALGEDVGTRRLVACAIGFVGTLLVVQPSFTEVGAPALLPLGVAVVFALFMLVTRTIAKEVDPIAMQAVSGAMAVGLLAPVFLLGGAMDLASLTLQSPPQGTLGLLVLLGLIGSIAHLFMTWSLRFAPSATLAPMQYLEIPFATLIGFLMFQHLPNGLAALGIVITMGAGLYIIAREQRTASRLKAKRAE